MTPSKRTWALRLIAALLSVFIVVVLLFVVEGALRLMGFGDPILYQTNNAYRFAPQANQKKQRRRGAVVTIESHGLRCVRDWSQPADLRVLFIGDSVTWGGTSIDDTETFAHRCGQLLEEKTGSTVVCGNAGVNAYGTDNMRQRLAYLGVDDEDVIVVTLISPDTTRGLTDLRGGVFFNKPPPGPFCAIWEIATFVLFKTALNMRFDAGLTHTDHDAAVAQESLARLLDTLKQKQQQGKKVLVILSPLQDELPSSETELTLQVRRAIAGSGLDFLDMYPVVNEHHSPGLFVDQMHLDVSGHELYAQTIATRIMTMLEPPKD